MAKCNDCTPIKPVPFCTTSLILGTITSPTTAVYIYMKDLATGRIHRGVDTTDGSGKVTLDMSKPDKQFYSPDKKFEVWVTLQSATDINTKENITLNALGRECLYLTTQKIYDDSDNLITYASITAVENV